MPVIPEFNPPSAPGAGFLQSQSLMMQAAANRRADESQEMDRIKFEVMRPVLESQARLQMVEHASGLATEKLMADYTTQALHEFPVLVKDWNDTSSIADPKERIAARREVIGRATPLAALKQTGPIVAAWQKQYADDAIADRTADSLQGKLDVTGANNDAKLAIADKNLAAKQAALDLQQQQFELKQAHAKELETIKAQHAQELQNSKAASAEKIAGQKTAALAERPREQAALKTNEAVLQVGNSAASELPQLQTALTLLQDPSIRTGTGAAFETSAKRLGEVLGLSIDTTKVANQEQLQAILGSSLLDAAKNLKGSISDKDVAFLNTITPNVARTNEGNLALVSFLVGKKQRDLEVAKIVQNLRREGASEREIQLEVNDFIQQTPIPVFQPAVGAPAGPVKIKSIKRID